MNTSNNNSDLLSGDLNVDEAGKYYSDYLAFSKGKPLLGQLISSKKAVLNFLSSLSEDDGLYSYDTGKWTVKEVIGHLIDIERTFSYRALAFARGETESLPGYDHNDYVVKANLNSQSVEQLKQQYQSERESVILLFKSFSDEMLMRKGTASNNPFTVRSLGFIIAGHEQHHLKIIRERYLPGRSSGVILD